MRKITLLLVFVALITSFNINAQITTYPYTEDFEAGAGGWVANNVTNGSWALGLPASVVINTAASGANSWVTNLTGNYNINESSSVTSPVFDFSSLNAPSISFSLWWESEFSWDGTVLQSSIDGGTTWVNVGAAGDDGNWFNDTTIGGSPGGQQTGWTGRNGTGSDGWVFATHALNGLGGESNVLLRFAFGSDGSITDEGVAFDNISIFEVTCPGPSNLAATVLSDSSADITWTAGGSETTWGIIIQTAGTGAPADTDSGTPTSNNAPYNATGLTASTAYEVYVRTICGGPDGNSIWVGPVNFTTFNAPPPPPVGVTCANGTASTIFTETFGDTAGTAPAGWTGTGFGGANGNWRITVPNSHSTDTGPNVTFDGNPGAHLEYEASGNSTNIASAISPAIDLTTATDGAELAFFMHAFGDDIGTLNIKVGTNAAGPFSTEYTWIGNYQTTATEPWVPIGVNLDAYLGQVIYLEFSYSGTGDIWEGDLALDQITVQTCGNFCIAPSNINAANITDTSADITWNANNGETQWEYVIQPAGTGEPTGPGNMTNTAGFQATGLTGLTPYEVYVLADCGGTQSVWAGPYNFTTDVQLNFTVDCNNGGPLTINYCYENNDTNVLIFTSSDGSPLNFTINSGQVEDGWDELVVLDSDGTTDLNGNTPYGVNGDGEMAGLTYQSSGDTISFQVQSDGSISCSNSNAINPLNITVSCATCINPTATFQIVDDCDNGDQFLVDVNITSLGDATSLEIQDNQGNAPVTVSATGNVTPLFGPYPFNTDIIFTVTNLQDPNCVITSPTLQLAACPPPNNNCGSATVAVVNDSFLCEMSTPGTLIEASPSGVPNPSCGGNPDDDVWFQFVATSEIQLIALANIQGSNTTNINHSVYEGTCGALTEISCTNGFAELSSITPQLTIGNTYYIRVYSNGITAVTTTFDLCITPYVAPTNITCDATENLCPGGDDLYTYNTVDILPGLGQIDCLGSSPNPTFSIIEIGTSGNIEIQMVQNTAFDAAGNPIGDELDVDFALWGPFNAGDDFCSGGDYPNSDPTACSYSAAPIENFTIANAIAGDIYIVLITNYEEEPGIIQINQTNLDPNNPDPNAGTLSGEIDVELVSNDAIFIDDDNDEATPLVANLCGFDSITLEADSPFADVFEWSVNGIFDPTLTGSSITVTESNTYTVNVFDTQCMGTDSQTVVINLYKEAIVSIVPDDEVSITTCDDESGDGIEEFDLDGLSGIILNTAGQDPADFLITFHETLNDAQTGNNPLASPYSATDGTVIYVRVEDVNSVGSGSGCASTNTSFVLTVQGALPEITGANDLELCDDNNDGTEPFNLELNTPPILNGQDPAVYDVTYHISQDDAETGANPLASPYNNVSIPQTIYARIQNTNAADCYKTTAFDLLFTDKPTLVQADNLFGCDSDADAIANYDLTANEAVIANGQTGLVFTYHTTLADAETSSNAIADPVDYDSAPATIFVRVENAGGCFETTTFDLELADKPVLVQSGPAYGCDDGVGNNAIFDLTTNEDVIANGQAGLTFSYYTSQADAETSSNAIADPTNYDSTLITIFVRAENAEGCFEVTTFELEFADKPTLVQSGPVLGCDDDDDGISTYDLTSNEAEIANGQTGFTFTYHDSVADAETSTNAIANPANFTGVPQVVYVRVENVEGCFEVTSFDLEFGIAPMTSFDSSIVYEVCPNTASPITVTATGDNYSEDQVSITWYYEGDLISGQTDLTLDNVVTAGTYSIVVMFNDGCTADPEYIEVEESETCIIPQGISPNGDGLNETFDLSSFDVQKLTIFNRNGIKVYEKTNYTNEWHGQSLDGDELPVGTYYYVMNYQGNKTKATWVYLNRENN